MKLPIEILGGTASLTVDLATYTTGAVMRAAYKLTATCYVFLERTGEGELTIYLQSKDPQLDAHRMVGELTNNLIDQQLREQIRRETRGLRELIVAQAFAEGNLLDPDRDDGDYEEDPQGIARRQ